MKDLIIRPIGILRTQYTEAGKVPADREAASRSMLAVAELDENYASGLSGLAPGTHVWLIYYHQKVRLVNAEKSDSGVFSTRSPVRPNPLGVSLVEVVKVEDNRLYFNYADMPDGSPLIDIRPYIASEDSPSPLVD
jgi:tRNA-Thr(GGU) m(6)t(6)A37 methyltransferase TsaA